MGFLSTLFACLMVVTAVACASPSPASTSTLEPSPAATATAVQSTPTLTPETFFLEVQEPEDEAVVHTAAITLHGRTAVDAVVTVNGDPVDVEADGGFTAEVILEEGPNSIEIIASDFEGNEETAVLAIIYIP